jgi:hypothetical protein
LSSTFKDLTFFGLATCLGYFSKQIGHFVNLLVILILLHFA